MRFCIATRARVSAAALAGLVAGSALASCAPGEEQRVPGTGGAHASGGSGSATGGSQGASGGAGSGGAAGSGGGAASGGAASGGAASGGASGGSSSTGGSNSGGAAAGGSNGGSGGAGAGGNATGGGAGSTATGGGGGRSGSGGTAGTASSGGRGGDAGGIGGRGGGAGGIGGAGGGVNGPFVCNMVMGGKLTSELFSAGFETNLDNARWQLKWQDDAFVQAWAQPQSSFWNAAIVSPCSRNTASPDRIVFMVFSWSVKTQSDWRMYTTQTINNIKAKYPDVRRIDLINQVRGPNNMVCPTPPAAGETVVVSPELEAAMGEVVAAFPGFVFLGPKMEARSCADLQGGGPHLTTAGNMAAATVAAQHFAQTQ